MPRRQSPIAGVTAVESIVALPALLSGPNGRHTVVVQGLAPAERMIRSLDLDGRMVAPPVGGIVMTRTLARALGVHRGDQVGIQFPGPIRGSQSTSLRVTALRRYSGRWRERPTRRSSQLAGLEGAVTSVAVSVRSGRIDAVRNQLAELPDIGHIQDLAAVRAQVHDLMALGWVMLLAMLVFSIVLAAAILFNTATLGILERRRELATLRALGHSVRDIALGITFEHGLLCALGLALGYPFAIVVLIKVLALYSSDLFRLPFTLPASTITLTVVGIAGVLLLAEWPALRQIAKESLATAVRTREG